MPPRGLAHHALAVLTRLGDHPVGLRLGVGQQAVGLGPGVIEHGVRVRVRLAHHRLAVLLGFAQQRIARIQHVLRVVEFTGDRVLDVVDQLEDITAGHHAAGRHRHTACFFDDRAELVERFKNSVHGKTLQVVVVSD